LDPKRSREITEEVFEHLVELASLELDAGEAEYLRRELNGQLRAIAQLEAIDLPEGLPATSHGVPYTEQTSPALREDRIEPCPDAEEILRQAPEVQERHIVVPDIPVTELE